MIPRPLWFLAGAGVGVYSMIRARQLAETLTVEGLRDRAGAAALGVRLLAEEVSTAQHAKEEELRERMGLRPSPHPALGAVAAKRSAPPELSTLRVVETPDTAQQEKKH